jgi:hypothetical protein
MTVAELIEELRKLPPHAPVWIQQLIQYTDKNGEPVGVSLPDPEAEVNIRDVRWEGNHVEIS